MKVSKRLAARGRSIRQGGPSSAGNPARGKSAKKTAAKKTDRAVAAAERKTGRKPGRDRRAARKADAKEASIKTRLTKRGKAAPPEIEARAIAREAIETAPAQVPSSAQIELVPHNLLHLCAFNHRARDPRLLAELADSIAVDGVLQNLTARPHPEKPGEFEIVNGGRRWEAVGILVNAGRVAADYPMPVRVRALGDLQVLRLVTVENIQRQDMHPIEEGEHFARLRDAGDTTENIAALIGKSQKWVQTRIALVDKLAPAAQSAFRDGAIGLWAALILTKEADPKRQTQLAGQVRDGYIANGQALLAQITARHPLVSAAHFDRARYDGPIIEDEDGVDGPWFGDIAQFERLQIEAIEETKKDLAGKWAFVEVLGVGQKDGFEPWMWPKSKNRKLAGAVIEIEHGFGVTVHEGVLRPVKPETGARAARRAADGATDGGADSNSGAQSGNGAESGGAEAGGRGPSGPDPLTAPPALTQPLMIHAKQQKTMAIQEALVLAPGAAGRAVREGGPSSAANPIGGGLGMRVALALSCMALMGDRTVCRIQPAEIRADDRARAPMLAATLAAFRPKLQDVLSPVARGKSEEETEAADLELMPFSDNEAQAPAAAFALLLGLAQDDLCLLFTALVAARCGTFNDYTPQLGDDDLAYQVAVALGIDMGLAWGGADGAWERYLKLCKKSRLVRLVQHMPGLGIDPKDAARLKAGELAGKIEAALQEHPEQRNCVPPELRFGNRAAIEALLVQAAPLAAADAAATGEEAAAPADKPKKRRGRFKGAAGIAAQQEHETARADPGLAAGEDPDGGALAAPSSSDPAAPDSAPESGPDFVPCGRSPADAFPGNAVFEDAAAAIEPDEART